MKNVTARFLKSVAQLSEAPRGHLPEIAFLGRSNVGKSSLINSLLGTKLAKTSATPWRTQLINYYVVNETFHFVDCPGYGYAQVPDPVRRRWHGLMEEYLSRCENLKLSLLLWDRRVAPTALDQQMWEWLTAHQRPLILVLTKSDKLSSHQLQMTNQRLQRWKQLSTVIEYSAIKHTGRRELWREIRRALTVDASSKRLNGPETGPWDINF